MKTSVQMPMAVVAVAIFVASTATVQAEDYLYETNNGTITITGYNGPDGDVNIPDTINGLSVTCIGDYAFNNYVFLTSVTIPDSVTTIGFGAFQACFSLTSATIGAGVTSIGVWAFSGCTSLTSITIPDSVTSIGDYAFSGCTSLTAIDTDPRNPNYSSVNGVLFNKSQTALIACPGGKTGAYIIPDNVTSIGDWAFLHCGSLTSVTIPDSVIIIEDGFVFGGIGGAFCGCTSLTNVNIGNGLTTIGACAFAECTSLTSVTIPNSVTNIGGYTFFACTSLSNVTVPDGVTSIEDLAFYCCTSLRLHDLRGSALHLVGWIPT